MDDFLPYDISGDIKDLDVIHDEQLEKIDSYDIIHVDKCNDLPKALKPYNELSEEEEKIVFMIRDGKTISDIRRVLGKKTNQQIHSILSKDHVSEVLKDLDKESKILLDANTELAIQTAANLMKYAEKEETRLNAAKVFISRFEKKEEIEAKSNSMIGSDTPVKEFMNKIVESAKNARGNVTINMQNNIIKSNGYDS